ncbi:hypothetical protein D3C84_1161720 [compost metagenome]
MLAYRPFGVQVQLATIEVEAVALVQGLVVEQQHAEGQRLDRGSLEADKVHIVVAVERA